MSELLRAAPTFRYRLIRPEFTSVRVIQSGGPPFFEGSCPRPSNLFSLSWKVRFNMAQIVRSWAVKSIVAATAAATISSALQPPPANASPEASDRTSTTQESAEVNSQASASLDGGQYPAGSSAQATDSVEANVRLAEISQRSRAGATRTRQPSLEAEPRVGAVRGVIKPDAAVPKAAAVVLPVLGGVALIALRTFAARSAMVVGKQIMLNGKTLGTLVYGRNGAIIGVRTRFGEVLPCYTNAGCVSANVTRFFLNLPRNLDQVGDLYQACQRQKACP